MYTVESKEKLELQEMTEMAADHGSLPSTKRRNTGSGNIV
jgi:hypothetical protein